MEPSLNPNMVPPGPGGVLGHFAQIIPMVSTGGFAFPNTFVEGMDCTAIQKETEGTLPRQEVGITAAFREAFGPDESRVFRRR